VLCSRGGLLCLPDQLHFVNTVLTARLLINWLTHDEDIALHHLSVPRDFIYGRQHCTTIWLNSWCALYGQSR
ncbi:MULTISPECIES: hypothetical protein, partial [unclassified Citrobacter]|uniref:hypothetical protein n=1 Tax=unclassified Citrobacter TaxID=2644389 RepID=UPI0025764F9F